MCSVLSDINSSFYFILICYAVLILSGESYLQISTASLEVVVFSTSINEDSESDNSISQLQHFSEAVVQRIHNLKQGHLDYIEGQVSTKTYGYPCSL